MLANGFHTHTKKKTQIYQNVISGIILLNVFLNVNVLSVFALYKTKKTISLVTCACFYLSHLHTLHAALPRTFTWLFLRELIFFNDSSVSGALHMADSRRTLSCFPPSTSMQNSKKAILRPHN